MALLCAKVMAIENQVTGIEKQLTHLITIMDELISQYAIKDQIRCESSCEKYIGEIANLVQQKLLNMESDIPLIIIDTINEVISGIDKSNIPLNTNITSHNIIDEKATIDISLSNIHKSPNQPNNP